MHSAMVTYSGSGPEPVANNRRSECFQPRSDNIEIPTFLRQPSPVVSLESEESVKGGSYVQQLSQTDSESGSLKNRSDFSLGSIGLNHNLNNNGNNNNVLVDGTNNYTPPSRRMISSGIHLKPSLVPPKSKANMRLRSDSNMPFVKRYMPVKTSDGPSSSAVMQKSASLPRSYSSDELAAETAVIEGNLQRKKSSSMELLDSESTNVYKTNSSGSRTTGKQSLSGKQRPPLRHRYSSPILDTSNTSQKSDDSFWFEYGCV